MRGAAKFNHTQKCGITLPISLVKQVDKIRGDIPRSIYQKSSSTAHSDRVEIMTNITDFASFAGTVGGGFLGGMLAGYAIKKVIRIAAVIVGLFIAAMAYLEYQRIINVDWVR